MITTSEFKNHIGKTNDDPAIDLIVAGTISYVETYCNNILSAGDEKVEEIFDGDEILENDGSCYLKNNANISDLVVERLIDSSWVTVSEDHYYVYSKEGLINFNSAYSGRRNYRVSYNAGYISDDTPSALKIACLQIASIIFNKRKSEGISSESVEGGSINWDREIPVTTKNILDKYKILSI